MKVTKSGPLSPAANMKPKWPRSWLPRVKLRRLRFIAASLGCGGAEPEPGEPAIVGLVCSLPQRAISMAGQERFEGYRDEQVLPYRVEGARPLSRFVFTLPGIDQLIANDDADGDLLVPGFALDPVSKWAGYVGLKTEMPIHVLGSN